MLILNYTLCVPTLFAVGMFSLFHFWSVGTNTTTIEGWEKDKVATLKRKGKIREVRPSLPPHSFRPTSQRADSPRSRSPVQIPLQPRRLRELQVRPGFQPPLLVLAPKDGRHRPAVHRRERSR